MRHPRWAVKVSRVRNCLLVSALLGLLAPTRARAYALEGYAYPPGSTIQMELALSGPASGHLLDGFSTFNQSAADALALWNQVLTTVKFGWTPTPVGGGQGDGRNSVFFSNTVFGQSFGGAIAITYFYHTDTYILEADTVFNNANKWDSYRGPLHYNAQKKQFTYDLHRVALHEFGHTLGLTHPDAAGQNVVAVMNSHTSDTDSLTSDDIDGVIFLYGLRLIGSLNPTPSFVGEPFYYQITANNNPTSFTASGLPSGLVLDSTTGAIAGTPTVFGTFAVNVTASGPQGTAQGTVLINISAPALVSSFPDKITVGQLSSIPIQATSHPTSFEATGIPPGLTLDPATGWLAGRPTVAGYYSIEVVAHTPYGDASGNFVLQVLQPSIVSSPTASVEIGTSYTYGIQADNSPTSFAAIGLPPGLSLDPNTGVIFGIPSRPGIFFVNLTARGEFADATSLITIEVTPRQITSATSAAVFTSESQFTYQILADNNPTSFSATLPPGLTLDPVTGIISGILTGSDSVQFTVIAHGDWGDAVATVTINPAGVIQSFTNLSTRGLVRPSDPMIGGFVITGAAPKKVGIRALGPTMSAFGVQGVLTDPRVEVRDSSGSIIAANNDWTYTQDAVQAANLAPSDPREAVVIPTLAPGNYTAIVTSANGGSGVALCELYDLEPGNARLSNISTRGYIGVGSEVMIAGFVLGGSEDTRVLVRGLGPTLADFGVNGVCADPMLEAYSGNGALIASNDDWRSVDAAAIQATGLAPPKDAEAAVLATLSPGAYTVVVRGKNSLTGIALIEVYNLGTP